MEIQKLRELKKRSPKNNWQKMTDDLFKKNDSIREGQSTY